MAYINSDYIKVFPSAKRGIAKPESRLTTEQNFVNIINKLLDTDGFVITKPEYMTSNNPFEFNIHGYYFWVRSLSDITDNFSSDTNIYANITLTSVGGNDEIADADDNNTYKGVQFSTSASGTYSLLILSRDSTSDTWTIPESSTIMFSISSININGTNSDPLIVDGGVI